MRFGTRTTGRSHPAAGRPRSSGSASLRKRGRVFRPANTPSREETTWVTPTAISWSEVMTERHKNAPRRASEPLPHLLVHWDRDQEIPRSVDAFIRINAGKRTKIGVVSLRRHRDGRLSIALQRSDELLSLLTTHHGEEVHTHEVELVTDDEVTREVVGLLEWSSDARSTRVGVHIRPRHTTGRAEAAVSTLEDAEGPFVLRSDAAGRKIGRRLRRCVCLRESPKQTVGRPDQQLGAGSPCRGPERSRAIAENARRRNPPYSCTSRCEAIARVR